MSSIEVRFFIPEKFVGAYQCTKTDVNENSNRILVISPVSTIQTALFSAERIRENCSTAFPGKCGSECPIAKKVEELSNLLLIQKTSKKI